MGGGSELEALVERSREMRESLNKGRIVTHSLLNILESFDTRLSDLDAAMRPTEVRTHSIRKAHKNIDNTLKAAQRVLTQFDILHQVESRINHGPHEDLGTYLAAVDQLQNVVEFLTSNKSFTYNKGALSHVHVLISKSLTKLEEEFRELLIAHSKIIEPAHLLESCPDYERSPNISPLCQAGEMDKRDEIGHISPTSFPLPIPLRVIPQLHELAKRIISSGHQEQCMKTYKVERSAVLERTLRKLGVQKATKEDIQKMPWETLEGNITNWMRFVRIAVKLLFSGERNICDQIFHDLDPYGEEVFAGLTSNCMNTLLSFGEAVAKSKTSPEKLFNLLDMYITMQSLIPEIDVIFSGKALAELRNLAYGLTLSLAQAAQDTFFNFEDNVAKDVTKVTFMDGTVHPLTSYVMNYVKFLYDYHVTLRQILGDDENMELQNTQFSQKVLGIMNALESNLEEKSKQYRDLALTHIFLMNNIHYMVKAVRRTDVRDLLGDDWVQRRRRVVQQHATSYKRVAWSKVLQCFGIQGLTGSNDSSGNSAISRSLLKERFKSFNLQFEDLHQKQSQWTILDTELRESLRLMVAEILLPAYRSFLKRHGSLLENAKDSQKYLKYKAEDLDRMLGDFFEGKIQE